MKATDHTFRQNALPKGASTYESQRSPYRNPPRFTQLAFRSRVELLDFTLTGRTTMWCGPLVADKNQAAVLTVGRGLRSSNCCGLK